MLRVLIGKGKNSQEKMVYISREMETLSKNSKERLEVKTESQK